MPGSSLNRFHSHFNCRRRMLRSLFTRYLALRQHIHFTGLGQQFDFDSFPHLLPGQFVSTGLPVGSSVPWACPPGRAPADHSRASARAFSSVGMPRSITQIRCALPYCFSIFSRKSLSVVLSLVLPAHHFVGQRKTFRRDDQRDDHLHAVRALVPAVTKFSFVLFGKRRIAFKIRAGQVVEQHVELRVEQILPALREVIEQLPLCVPKSNRGNRRACGSRPVGQSLRPTNRPSRCARTNAGASATRCPDRSSR